MGRLGGVDEEALMRRFWDWELLDPRGAGGWERLGEVGLLGAAEAGKRGADEPGVDWGWVVSGLGLEWKAGRLERKGVGAGGADGW